MLVPESIIIDWTLVDDDWCLVGAKRGAARLGFALLMRYFRLHGRFPRSRRDLPTAAVGYVARQLRVPSASIREYQWSGRTIESHRAQIRAELGFREATRDDEARLVAWLADELAPVERSNERLVEALRSRCRQERIEPPARWTG